LPPRDIKRELVVNMVSNIILKGEIYVIIYSLLSELHKEDIIKLREVHQNQALLKSKFSLEALGVKREFQMNEEERSKYAFVGKEEELRYDFED
jgi:hypothetical protein